MIIPSVEQDMICLRFGLKMTYVILSLCPLNDLYRAGSVYSYKFNEVFICVKYDMDE